MRLDELLRRILAELERERVLARRLALIAAPLLLFPLMALAAQMMRSGWGLFSGALGAAVLLAQFELLTRPTLLRVRGMGRDVSLYLTPPVAPGRLRWSALRWADGRLCLPGVISALSSLAIFVPTALAQVALWQRIAAVSLGLGMLYVFCQRLLHMQRLIADFHRHFAAELERHGATYVPTPGAVIKRDTTGLLDPALLERLEAQPMPAMRLSPAALALLRTEGYLLLRDAPDNPDEVLRAALPTWAEQAHADELGHWLLPPVGGKIYLPCAAAGMLANTLGVTARRLGMDGAYSGVLRTWLVRLPPARSYAVAARLIDALIALGMLPQGAILIHHLTVAGDLGAESTVPALLHLLATPLLFEERPGHASKDDRPFIMRGGGVLDDLDRGQRTIGPRTDFVDGFLMVNAPGMEAVEHLMGHAINLRLKQVLAWAIYAAGRPVERRSPAEQQAAVRYERLRADLSAFLTHHDLQGALAIRWLDGRWSEQWPYVRAISERKQIDPEFLGAAQALRDAALDDLEDLALRAMGQRRRAA